MLHRYSEEPHGLPRSSSIDSMVEGHNCSPLTRKIPSPLLTRSPPPPLSPSVARRMKGQRAGTGESGLACLQTIAGREINIIDRLETDDLIHKTGPCPWELRSSRGSPFSLLVIVLSRLVEIPFSLIEFVTSYRVRTIIPGKSIHRTNLVRECQQKN